MEQIEGLFCFFVWTGGGGRHGHGNKVTQIYQRLFIEIHSFFIRTFYKNILDRFWEKIKKFCKITFSPKVLKWQKCDIRTSYVTLEKLRTFPQKIHKFSNVKPKFLP